jgi:hypothetical protein
MTVDIDADLLAGLRAVQARAGITVSEQIRRAASAWVRQTWRLNYIAPVAGRGWKGVPLNLWVDEDVWIRLKGRQHFGTAIVDQLRAALGNWLQEHDVLPAARGKDGRPVIRFRRMKKVADPKARPAKKGPLRGMDLG